jgi:uncharacterized membrane protein YjgN (DUF898 family)
MEGYPRGPEQGYYQKPSNGTLILILGILGLVCCGLLGPVAWIMGNQSLGDIKRGAMDPKDEGLVQAGRIIGMITTGLIVLGILFYGVIIALAIFTGAAGSTRLR